MNRLRKMFSLFRLNEPRAHVVFMSLVFLVLGLGLLLQPSRFANTPSYANLLQIAPQWAWGTAYLFGSLLKALSIWRFTARSLIVVTHTYSFILVFGWLSAFVVRWITDGGTTVVNVVSWSTFLYLIVRSAMMVDDHTTRGE